MKVTKEGASPAATEETPNNNLEDNASSTVGPNIGVSRKKVNNPENSTILDAGAKRESLKGSTNPPAGSRQEKGSTDEVKRVFVNLYSEASGKQKLCFTVWENVKGVSCREITVPWTGFCAFLEGLAPTQIKTDALLIKLATFGDQATARGSLRHDGNVKKIWGIEGDYDGEGVSPEDAISRLEKQNIRAVVVTTHSHTPDKPRWRVLAPLSQSFGPEKRRKFVARLNGALEGILGGESFNLSQSYFIGGKPGGEYRVLNTFKDPEKGSCLDDLSNLDKIADYGGTTAIKHGKPVVGELNKDLQAAQDAGLEPQHLGGGKWAVLCPWRDQHSRETGKSSTAYFEAHTNGFQSAGFRCLHAHCNTKDIRDFHGYLGIQGGGKAHKTLDDLGLSTQDIVNAAFEGQKGCAELFIKLCEGIFCYDHSTGLWYQYSGHYWEEEEIDTPIKALDQIQVVFKQTLAKLRGEAIEAAQDLRGSDKETEGDEPENRAATLKIQQKQLRSIIKNLNNLPFRKQVVEFSTKGPDSLGITGKEWDCKPWELACENGIINLKTGWLRQGKPEDYIKSHSPTPYDPKADCPAFKKFLSEVLQDDEDLVLFMQRILGAGLIGESSYKQYLVILYGDRGRNGKDTLQSIISHVLGKQLSGGIQSEMLLDGGRFSRRNSQGPSADIMRLRGLRLAWAKETSEGSRFDSGMAKELTGGGKIAGRVPYGKSVIEFEQSHLIILHTNSRPHVQADDSAFWKRVKTVPFELSFVDDPKEDHERQKIEGLADNIKPEASGILRWLVEGCLDYQKHGLPEPEAVKHANEEYIKDEDLLGHFLEEKYVFGEGFEVKSADLYRSYKLWAEENNHRPFSGTRFGTQMGKRFMKKQKGKDRVTWYVGLKSRSTAGVPPYLKSAQ